MDFPFRVAVRFITLYWLQVAVTISGMPGYSVQDFLGVKDVNLLTGICVGCISSSHFGQEPQHFELVSPSSLGEYFSIIPYCPVIGIITK